MEKAIVRQMTYIVNERLNPHRLQRQIPALTRRFFYGLLPDFLDNTAVKVSIIIPTLNEAGTIEKTLLRAQGHNPHEIIICDGGSRDGTLVIAEKHPTRIVTGWQGRALQMNAAARAATGDILLFLHADNFLESAGYEKMVAGMQNEALAGGAFSLGIESDRWSLTLIASLATWRSKLLHLTYGDQAIFARTGIFKKVGGFSPIPICEDLDFFRKLRKEGNIRILNDKTITSARRWLREGVVFTTLRNTAIAALFIMGVSPKVLSRWFVR